jgi:hypothetical protein
MKKIIFVLVVFACVRLLVSCSDYGCKLPPAVTPIPVSISANSAVIEWKSVGKEFCYKVVCIKPNVQEGWWVDNEQGYYLYDDDRDYNNPKFLNDARKDPNYGRVGSVVWEVDSTQETSVKIDNLEKSTIYYVGIDARKIEGSLSNYNKLLYFRTKDE